LIVTVPSALKVTSVGAKKPTCGPENPGVTLPKNQKLVIPMKPDVPRVTAPYWNEGPLPNRVPITLFTVALVPVMLAGLNVVGRLKVRSKLSTEKVATESAFAGRAKASAVISKIPANIESLRIIPLGGLVGLRSEPTETLPETLTRSYRIGACELPKWYRI